MIFVYYIFIWIAYIIFAILIFFLSIFKSKYKLSLKSRFFLYKNLFQRYADVHFHVCSYGEVKSIKQLVDNFDSRISVITQTGYDEAKKYCKKVNFLAFENFIPFWLKKCKILVVFEAEYWLMLFFIAKLKGAKIIILNARISDKSLNKYLKFSFFYKKIFSYVDEVIAQSKEDKERFQILGAKNITIDKNLKAYLKIKPNKKYEKIKEQLIIFASTHKDEEELLLKNFNLNQNQRLIIAPRHPERFDEVEQILKKNNLDYEKFTFLNNDFSKFSKKILLLDSLGELINFYAISDVVVLGGSFVKNIGGHNPIEVANFNNVLISGVYIDNQKSLYNEVENVNFCEDLSKINDLIQFCDKKAKLKNNENLDNIISIIQRNLNAR